MVLQHKEWGWRAGNTLRDHLPWPRPRQDLAQGQLPGPLGATPSPFSRDTPAPLPPTALAVRIPIFYLSWKFFLCCSHQWTLGYKGSRQVVAAATLKFNHEAFGGQKRPFLAPCISLWQQLRPGGHLEVTGKGQDLSPQSCSINPSCQGTFPRSFPKVLGS